MIEFIYLGSTPPDEPCAQLGTYGYGELVVAECERYRKLILQKFGEPPAGVDLRMKWAQHDYGDYAELVVFVDPADKAAQDWALAVEWNGPLTWDDTEPHTW